MGHNPLLGPVVVLVAWSIVVLVWMGRVRFAAMKSRSASRGTARPGARGQNLEGVIPDEANWPSHNYTHLMEQPTLFYAIVLALVAMGDRTLLSLVLAWAYVGLRIVHSIWQIKVNQVSTRFRLFLLSTLCLLALTVKAGLTLLIV